jgi:hypothetical protein
MVFRDFPNYRILKNVSKQRAVNLLVRIGFKMLPFGPGASILCSDELA